jgi:hypothetical protein
MPLLSKQINKKRNLLTSKKPTTKRAAPRNTKDAEIPDTNPRLIHSPVEQFYLKGNF